MKKNTVGFGKLTVFLFCAVWRRKILLTYVAGEPPALHYSGSQTPQVIMNMPLRAWSFLLGSSGLK